MPRRALLLITALVLALHWLTLASLPLGGTGHDAPQHLAFQTRTVAPPPPPPPAPPEAAPAAPPEPTPPAARPKPKRKPRPQPPHATPQPAPEIAAPEPPAATLLDATPETAPDAEPEAARETMPETALEMAPETPPDTAPQAEPATAPDLAPAPVPATPAASAASAPQDMPVSAGVEIRAPGAAGAAASSDAPPVRLPPSTRLSFDAAGQVKQLHYSASAELLWHQDGARYEARQRVSAFLVGSRTQTSVGEITAHGLRPRRFGDKSRSERAAHFDFERGEVIFSANTPRAAIGDGAQDRLSVFIQLGAMLAAAPERYPPGTQITLTTVGPRNADRWSFTVEGAETLELPAGTTPALKLQRLPPEGPRRDQKAELWLGTQLDYLPVRIRITQGNGDFADLQLTGHEPP